VRLCFFISVLLSMGGSNFKGHVLKVPSSCSGLHPLWGNEGAALIVANAPGITSELCAISVSEWLSMPTATRVGERQPQNTRCLGIKTSSSCTLE